MSEQQTTSILLNIGPSKDSLAEVTKSIVEILSLERCGDGPKQEAMITIRELVKVEDVTVSNCVFNGGGASTRKATAKKAKRAATK